MEMNQILKMIFKKYFLYKKGFNFQLKFFEMYLYGFN